MTKRKCAPWCGAGCTETEWQTATSRAETLAAYLGHGWKAEVWENLGWHWKVVHVSGVEVYPHQHRGEVVSYWANLNTDKDIMKGRQFHASAKTAHDAVRSVTAQVRAEMRRIEGVLEVLERGGR